MPASVPFELEAPSFLQNVLLSVGLLLAAGTAAGWVAQRLRLPALTGYILAGVLLQQWPSLLERPEPAYFGHFELLFAPVNDFAMALVLFVLGGHIRLDRLRGLVRPILTIAGLESLITFLLVTVLCLPALRDPAAAVLLGILAVAVAPATTLVVLRELRSRGPLTEAVSLLTALSNVLAVFAFEIALLLLVSMQGTGREASALPILWDLAGSVLVGLVAGHALILLQERIGLRNPALPLATILFLAIGTCQIAGVPHMLAFLATGAVVANRSRFFEPITGALDSFAPPAYVAFFVLSGWHLDFQVFLASGTAIGLYVGGRALGKILGVRLAMRLSSFQAGADRQVGLGLLCQAGAAIALAGGVSQRYDPKLSELLLSVILGAVVVFELAGPVLLRHAVVAAGEVPMSQLLVRGHSEEHPGGWIGSLRRALAGRSLRTVEDLPGIAVRRLMRSASATLRANAGLDEILRFANHFPYNLLPVVDAQGRFSGMVSLIDLEDFAYDPKAASLVIAADVTRLGPEESSLAANATLEQAGAFFQGFEGNIAAVVDAPASMRFLGMVERAEVLRLMRLVRTGR